MVRTAVRRTISVRGLEFVEATNDPFIVVANHSQRPEAALLPTLLIWHRAGKPIHFTSDWAARFTPRAAVVIKLGQVIPVFTKRARNPLFQPLKHIIQRRHPGSVLERAAARLQEGAPVGFFPEGTVNRSPTQLLRGRYGAARLALETGVPIVPIGIRFPERESARKICDEDRMAIEIGPPLPGEQIDRPRTADIRDAHAQIMRSLERLSGKTWDPRGPLRSIDHVR